MNTDELIEQIHFANVERRQIERRINRNLTWHIAVSAAAVAAILLIVLLPHDKEVQAATSTPGIYCNSQCNPDDVMALIDNNINHIKEIRTS